MMKTALLIGLAALAVVSADEPNQIWSSCASSGAHLTNVQIQVTPNPPTKGNPITIAASGTLDEQVTGGNIDVDVKYLGIDVYNKKLDLCKTLAKSSYSCPVAKGPLSAKVTEKLPSDAPSGHYTGKATLNDQNGEELTCIKLDFKLQ